MIRFFFFILLFFLFLFGPIVYTKKRPSKKGLRNRVICIGGFLLVLFFVTMPAKSTGQEANQQTIKETTKETTTSPTSESKETTETTHSSESQNLTIDWQKPSETKAYPELKATDWIEVSLADQRVYFKRDDETLYTMYCSTGIPGKNDTPKGTFEIQPERGLNFYNATSGEGANYYVSFLNHGEYLFHTVPVDRNGDYIQEEAEKLGIEPNSHGCIRLSVPDAKWFYDHAITGMKVVIA